MRQEAGGRRCYIHAVEMSTEDVVSPRDGKDKRLIYKRDQLYAV